MWNYDLFSLNFLRHAYPCYVSTLDIISRSFKESEFFVQEIAWLLKILTFWTITWACYQRACVFFLFSNTVPKSIKNYIFWYFFVIKVSKELGLIKLYACNLGWNSFRLFYKIHTSPAQTLLSWLYRIANSYV